MTRIEFHRLPRGLLIIRDAEKLALDFFDSNPDMREFDDRAGRSNRRKVVRQDIAAINSTRFMGARSPYEVWEDLIGDSAAWLVNLRADWKLAELSEQMWSGTVRSAVERAFLKTMGPGRGQAVASKLLYWKRPELVPPLDSLVVQWIGTAESPIQLMDHMRAEAIRNKAALEEIQHYLAIHAYDRSLVRILDSLLWASHPTGGLRGNNDSWIHTFGRRTRTDSSPKS